MIESNSKLKSVKNNGTDKKCTESEGSKKINSPDKLTAVVNPDKSDSTIIDKEVFFHTSFLYLY